MKWYYSLWLASVLVLEVQGDRAQAASLKEALANGSYWTRPADPIDASIQPDFTQTSSDVVGSNGGSLSLTDKKGVVFTLNIPSGALLEPVTVRMSAISSASGLPEGAGPVSAVLLQPSGLLFESPATLTIATLAPFGEQRPFAFTARTDGRDVTLAQRSLRGSGATIIVPHFSTVGIARATSPGAEQAVARSVQRSQEFVLQNAVAHLNPDGNFGESPIKLLPAFTDATDRYDFLQLWRTYFDVVLLGRINIALQSRSCSDAAAVVDLTRFFVPIQRDIPESPFKEELMQIKSNFNAAFKAKMRPLLKRCIDESVLKCRSTLVGAYANEVVQAIVFLGLSEVEEKRLRGKWEACNPLPNGYTGTISLQAGFLLADRKVVEHNDTLGSGGESWYKNEHVFHLSGEHRWKFVVEYSRRIDHDDGSIEYVLSGHTETGATGICTASRVIQSSCGSTGGMQVIRTNGTGELRPTDSGESEVTTILKVHREAGAWFYSVSLAPRLVARNGIKLIENTDSVCNGDKPHPQNERDDTIGSSIAYEPGGVFDVVGQVESNGSIVDFKTHSSPQTPFKMMGHCYSGDTEGKNWIIIDLDLR